MACAAIMLSLLLAASQTGNSANQPLSVIARAERTIPSSAGRPDADHVVLVNATIAADGTVADARAMPPDRVFGPAAVEAVRSWRFSVPGKAPVRTVIGVNFARSDHSGAPAAAVPVGGAVKVPRALSIIAAVLPPSLPPGDERSGVLVEMTIDAAGIPIDAIAREPFSELSGRAVDAALRSRFEADRKVPRRLVKVSVPFDDAGIDWRGWQRRSSRRRPIDTAAERGGAQCSETVEVHADVG